jgi:hypothetical protein
MSPISPTDRPPKPRLLVLLGAGSTCHAGAPLTSDITDLVSKIREEPICSVVEYLRNQRSPDGFDFETILASLEELDEFSLRKRAPNARLPIQYIGGNLSAFAELLPDFARSAGDKFLEARYQLIGRIKDFVIKKTSDASAASLKIFFDRLKEEFDLTVATLNYDDLTDRAGEWYDGFFLQSSPNGFGAFDFAGFPHSSATKPAVLLHLHGSVRFEFPPLRNPPERRGEIVRYGSPRYGIGATLDPPSGIATPTPIVAGGGKDRWLTRAGVPFGYYYNAFIGCVTNCSRLLVGGYADGDPHVNSWIYEEHPRIHGARCRVVHVNPASKVPCTTECLTLAGSDGYFPPQEANQIQQIVDFLKSLP